MNRFDYVRAGTSALTRAAALALIALVAACTAGGPPTTQNQQTSPGSAAANYTGPPAQNDDTRAFAQELWANIRTPDKCGGCHHEGGQSPMFARSDDVNAAYQEATRLINLQDLGQSELVLKVGGGHNCWLADAGACHDTMLTWIKKWVGGAGNSSTTVVLTPPTSSDVGGGKQFPEHAATRGELDPNSPNSFQETVYPLLTQFCVNCHQAAAAVPQTPYFAAANVEDAYIAAQPKINLNSPELSRFYVRLHDEHHNCWAVGGTVDCAQSSAKMLDAINTFANAIKVKPVDTSQVLSKALKLKDGTVASGGNRSEANLVAKYEFKSIVNGQTFDTSGVSPAANLDVFGPVTVAGGWGINIAAGGRVQATTATSPKFTSMLASSGEFTIETWVAPANVAQTSAWIVSYSGSEKTRNFTLGQKGMQFQAVTRSDKTDANGGTKPTLTDATKFPVQAALTHLVLTYDPINGQKLYMNGVDTGAVDPNKGGSLASWDNTFALVLGAETNGKDQWLGTIKFLAIHSRALTKDQVQQNYDAGVGERYFLLFDVSALTGVSQAYVEMTGFVLDSYGYQFANPTFISLDPNAMPANIPIKGMRVGVNGIELPTGQSYATVDTTLKAPDYTPANGQVLSKVGAVIASDKGVDSDVFFLTFDQLGTHTHVHTEPAVPVLSPNFPDVPPPTRGVKNFAQFNAALARITGVPLNNTAVNTLYNTLQQSLPPSNDLGAFLASHQTAISALADQYCNVAATSGFFAGLNLNNGDTAAYFASPGNRNLIIDPLVAHAIGSNVDVAGMEAAIRTELNSLITALAPTNNTASGRTAVIAQAACTAVLGSAAVTLQ